MVSRVLPLHWVFKNGGLNKRAYACLKRAGIRHMGELSNKTRYDIAAYPYMYMATALHIEAVMRIHGLSLREAGQSGQDAAQPW